MACVHLYIFFYSNLFYIHFYCITCVYIYISYIVYICIVCIYIYGLLPEIKHYYYYHIIITTAMRPIIHGSSMSHLFALCHTAGTPHHRPCSSPRACPCDISSGSMPRVLLWGGNTSILDTPQSHLKSHIYMYVCTYVRTYVRTYVCMYIYIYKL